MSTLPDVRLEQLSVQVQGRTLLALDELLIPAGQKVAILGPNGAGKSTLLKVIGMQMLPSSGHVEVLGTSLFPAHKKVRRAEKKRLRSTLAWIPQGLHVVGRLSARGNAVLGGLSRVHTLSSMFGFFPPAEWGRADDALACVGLSALAHRRADTLSGGERQKVAIARALVQGGRLLLADEPTSALDPAASVDVLNVLTRLNQSLGRTTVVVLHDIDRALGFADRIIGLKQGRVVLDTVVQPEAQASTRHTLMALYGHPADHGIRNSG